MPITDLALITVTGKYLNLDGSPASGSVSFATTTTIINQTANEIVVPQTFTANLNGLGELSLTLPATDDPDLEPTGWTYTVTENIGLRPRTYDIEVPHNTPGGTLDLADAMPVPSSAGVSYPTIDGGTP